VFGQLLDDPERDLRTIRNELFQCRSPDAVRSRYGSWGKVYLFAGVVVLVSAMRQGPSPQRVRVLDACPDVEWRVIIALTRFGGLRVPAEVQTLGWTDIDWESNRWCTTGISPPITGDFSTA
jgi:hypothetical protein